MSDPLIPDYSRRNLVIQPHTTRSRAPFRGVMNSERWNLEAELIRYDLCNLRSKLEQLKITIKNNSDLLTDEPSIVTSNKGHINFPGPLPNSVVASQSFAVTDASADFRAEFTVPESIDSNMRILSGTPFLLQLDPTYIAVIVQHSDNTFRNVTKEWANISWWPPAGARLQIRGVWDAATDTLSCYLRHGGPDLLDDSVDWELQNSANHSTNQLWTGTATFRVGNNDSDLSYTGNVYRAAIIINSTDLLLDINIDKDVTDPDAATIVASSGQTFTITRGDPPLKIVLADKALSTFDDLLTRVSNLQRRIRRIEIQKGLEL